MSLNTNDVNIIIEKVQRQLSTFNSAIELICIPHKTGERKNACLGLKKGYSGESISPLLNKLLATWMRDEDLDDRASTFLGTIETHKRGLVGIIKKKLFLNIIALNISNYKSKSDLEIDLYRLSWNACNAVKNVSDSSKNEQKDRILIPSPKGIRALGNNLQADIFAALTYSLINKEDKVLELGQKRAQSVIQTENIQTPENYPYIMTLDQTVYMYNQLATKRKLTSNILEQVWASSKVILQTMNQKKLKVWQKFSEYSQDMAWRGFSGEVILSIAIDRNDDIETKKLGLQVAKLTDTEPVSSEESGGYFNPFKTDAENAELHYNLIEEQFESLITRAIFENSSLPFIEKAYEHNMKLKKGQFIGWCANALQDAADVFEKTLKAKQPPTQTTREIFKTSLSKITLTKLNQLSADILKYKREHSELGNRDFINFLSENASHQIISDSVIRSFRKNKVRSENISLVPAHENDEIYGPSSKLKKAEEALVQTIRH